jgi:hypothetical protein
VGDEWNGGRHDASEHEIAPMDDLERQAREAMDQIRSRFGDLGSRVRRVVERASAHWEASAPMPASGGEVPPKDRERARALAQRWADIDFLVDPELAAGLTVLHMEDAALWRVELRERGETRTLEERISPYRGTDAPQVQPLRPVWEYDFPATPEIESGERRERLPGTGSVQPCDACSGTGRRACRVCGGRGSDVCPRCRGSARLTCPRCRGRGRIPAVHSGMHAMQAQSEHLATDAYGHIVHFAERLRQDRNGTHGTAPEWAAAGAAPDGTIPCPDCENGTIACDCNAGMRPCAACGGQGVEECPVCRGSGKVVHHREVVRRFDTRVGVRTLPPDERVAHWAPPEVLVRCAGEQVWSGRPGNAVASQPPAGVSGAVWKEAVAFAATSLPSIDSGSAAAAAAGGERRVLSHVLSMVRLPLTRMEYVFAERQYVVVAFGARGAERFWAETFPHRWSRVSRFLRAISRDLSDSPPWREPGGSAGQISALEDYRARRAGQDAPETDAGRTGPPAAGETAADAQANIQPPEGLDTPER